MRKSIFLLVLAMLPPAFPLAAQPSTAYHYKWRDDHGLIHYSDSLSEEAIKNGYDLVNEQGLTVQRVGRQLTNAERAQAQLQAEQAASEKRRADDKARADAQMLSAYPDETAYRVSQQQTLDTLDQQIATIQINLRSHKKNLADLLDRAAVSDRAKLAVPKALSDNIQQEQSTVAAQQATLESQQNDRIAMLQQQALQLQHYRELKAAQTRRDGS